MEQHKYLTDLGIDIKKCGVNFMSEDDPRFKIWTNFKEIYSVDPRETWNLGNTMFQWLYERLKAFVDLSKIVVSLSEPTIEISEESKSLEEWIDECLRLLEKILSINDLFLDGFMVQHEIEKMFTILAHIWPCLWW